MSAADYGLEGGAGEGSATTSFAAPPLPPSTLTSLATTPSDPVPASAPPLREDQVSNAVSFLVHPKVRRRLL